MKKLKVFSVILIAFVMIYLMFSFIFPLNFFKAILKENIILYSYANQLYQLPLPEDTVCIKKDKFAGNPYENGNWLHFYARIEVESSLTEEELIAYYSDKKVKPANEVSLLKPKPGLFDDKSFQREPIPVRVSRTEWDGAILDENMFIIYSYDTSYTPEW